MMPVSKSKNIEKQATTSQITGLCCANARVYPASQMNVQLDLSGVSAEDFVVCCDPEFLKKIVYYAAKQGKAF